MIFIAKNEFGTPSCILVQNGTKTVTRRMKPLPVGKEFAVQPGRGKHAICRARVIACDNSLDHFHKHGNRFYKQDEAKKEGFESWDGLMRWFQDHKINFIDTYRIEFETITKEETDKMQKGMIKKKGVFYPPVCPYCCIGKIHPKLTWNFTLQFWECIWCGYQKEN